MVASFPSNEGGIGGRGRNATEEDYTLVDELARNYYHGGTNILAANSQTNNQTNHYAGNPTNNNSRNRNQCRRHSQAYLHEPRVGPSNHRSPWDENQALRAFQAQYRQFDRGTHDPPSSQGPPRSQSVTFHPRSHNRTSILRAS